MSDHTHKRYLIRIENTTGSALFTTIHGDTPSAPFSIAGNLWNYKTPWTAARKLEALAKSWEKRGRSVTRIYGSVYDMPRTGNQFNAGHTVYEFTR